MLSAIKEFSPKSKFYFAGSSEMFGRVKEIHKMEKLHLILDLHMAFLK